MESKLRVSVGSGIGASESGPAKRTRCCSRRRRLSSRVLLAGMRIDLDGTDLGGSRIARKVECVSRGCRSSGGGAGRSSEPAGGLVLAGGQWAYLSQRIYVRISLTLNTFDSSGCFEQDTWSVFHRMLFSTKKVSGARTTQSPRDFFLKCHPMIMSPPVSDDGLCLVGPDAGLSGVLGLRSWSSARKVRNSLMLLEVVLWSRRPWWSLRP